MKDKLASIGSKATIWRNGISIPVYVQDIRSAYGRIDYRVSPIGGSGSIWISETNVEFNQGGKDD